MLSHRAWQNRFGADLSVVGRVVRLGTTEHTVIGVTPESFVVNEWMQAPELYVAATQRGLVQPGQGDGLTDRNREQFLLLGRLRLGVTTVADARANLSVLTRALATEYPNSMEHSELWVMEERRARPLPSSAGFMAPMMTIVMALATLVLLIACANVATLLVGPWHRSSAGDGVTCGIGARRSCA